MKPTGAWEPSRGAAELLRIAADLIEDECFEIECDELIKVGASGYVSEAEFRETIEDVLEWDAEPIQRAVHRVKTGADA